MINSPASQTAKQFPKQDQIIFANIDTLFNENIENNDDVVIQKLSNLSVFLSKNNHGVSVKEATSFFNVILDKLAPVNNTKIINLIYEIGAQLYLQLGDDDIICIRNLGLEKISNNFNLLSIFLELFTSKNSNMECKLDPDIVTQCFCEVFDNISYCRKLNMIALLCTTELSEDHLLDVTKFIWNFALQLTNYDSKHYYQMYSAIITFIHKYPIVLSYPNDLFDNVIEEFSTLTTLDEKEERMHILFRIFPFCNNDLIVSLLNNLMVFLLEEKNQSRVPNIKKELTILSECEIFNEQLDIIWNKLRPLFDDVDSCESAIMLASAFINSFNDKSKTSFLIGKCEKMIFNDYYIPYIYISLAVLAPCLRHVLPEIKREILEKWTLPENDLLQKLSISFIKRLFLSGILNGSEASIYLKVFIETSFPQYYFSVYDKILKEEPNNEAVINNLREVLFSDAPTLIKCLCLKSLSECGELGQFAIIAFSEAHNAMNEENVEAFLYSLEFICALLSSSETLKPQEHIYPLYQFALSIVTEHSEESIISDAAKYAAIISQLYEDDKEFDFQFPNELLDYLITNDNIELKEAGYLTFYNVMLQHEQGEAINIFDQLYSVVSENDNLSILKLSFNFAKAIVQNADPIPMDHIEPLVSAAIRGILPALENFPAHDFPEDFGFFDLIKALIKKGIPTFNLYAFHCLPLVDSELVPSVCSTLKAAIKRDIFPSDEAIPLFDSYLNTLDGFSDEPEAVSSLLDLLLPMATALDYRAGEHHMLILLLNIREREDGNPDILSVVIPAIITLLARVDGADVPLEMMRGIWEDITEGFYRIDYETVLDEAIRATEKCEEVTLDVARVLAHFVSTPREKLKELGIKRVQKYAQRLKTMMENSEIAGEIESLFLDNPKRESMFASRINMI